MLYLRYFFCLSVFILSSVVFGDSVDVTGLGERSVSLADLGVRGEPALKEAAHNASEAAKTDARHKCSELGGTLSTKMNEPQIKWDEPSHGGPGHAVAASLNARVYHASLIIKCLNAKIKAP